MKIVTGDLLELTDKGCFDVIAHGCNCFNSMSGGIARQIAIKWPQAQMADNVTTSGSINKLGTISFSKTRVFGIGDTLDCDILNLYTQITPGKDLSLTALRMCLEKISILYRGQRIGLPKIGSGIAGGDWKQIQKIIEEVLDPNCNVTIVELLNEKIQ